MTVSALRLHPDIHAHMAWFQAILAPETTAITQVVLKMLPAELRDTYLAMRPYKAAVAMPVSKVVDRKRRRDSPKDDVSRATETRRNYINGTENCHMLGQSRITYFQQQKAVSVADLMELPEYAYSDYRLIDIVKKPPKVDFSKDEVTIGKAIYRREFWMRQMEEYSRRIMDAFAGTPE